MERLYEHGWRVQPIHRVGQPSGKRWGNGLPTVENEMAATIDNDACFYGACCGCLGSKGSKEAAIKRIAVVDILEQQRRHRLE
eukprot:jgi/Psemu1/29777/gm1.29777_g